MGNTLDRYEIESIAWDTLVEVDKVLEDEFNVESILKTIKRKKLDIDDYGEHIYGARKDMLSDLAKTIDTITVQALVQNPVSKVLKTPNLKKMVDSGAFTDRDAKFVYAVLCSIQKKPQGTSYRSMNKVREWAEITFGKIMMIKSILIEDQSERDKLIDSYINDNKKQQESLDEYYEKLVKWNSDQASHFAKNKVANTYDVMIKVLDRCGYKPGDKLDIPFTRINTSAYSSEYHEIYGAEGESFNTTSSYYPVASASTIDKLIDKLCFLVSVSNKKDDIQIPIDMFVVRHGKPIYEKLDTYRGGIYVATSGWNTKWVASGEGKPKSYFEDLLKEWKEKHPNKEAGLSITQEVKCVGYSTHKILINILNKTYEKEVELSTVDETRSYIEEHYEEINDYFVEQITGTSLKKKKTPKDKFFVIKEWDKVRKVFVYVVCFCYRDPFLTTVKKFDKEDDANKFILENAERIYNAVKEADKEKIQNFNTRGKRVGKDWRKGKDVDEKSFCEEFGMRGVQFGNWTNLENRQDALNECFDSFCDLADILGWGRRALSLNGELGIAFGSRGSGSANAHYESSYVVINITKTRGAGSLAHEWWHALDNYFERLNGNPALFLTDTRGNVNKNLRTQIVNSMREITKAVEKSEYKTRSERQGVGYWGSMIEMTARMFQVYISYKLQEKGQFSPFLERGGYDENCKRSLEANYSIKKLSDKDYKGTFEEFCKSDERFAFVTYPYATKEENDVFTPLIDNFFSNIECKETEGKVKLSGCSDNTMYITEDTLVDDKMRALKNIEEYKRGDYYFDVNEPVAYVVKSLCGMICTRGGRIGYYGEYENYYSIEINGYERSGKSVVSVTVIDDNEHTFKYEIGKNGKQRKTALNSIVNDIENCLKTGKYIKK